MLFKTPKTATAMALALGLAAPMPLFAQDASTAELPECMEMVTLPCVTATGAVVEGQAELDTYLSAFPEEAAAAAERAAQEAAGEAAEPPATEDAGPPESQADTPEAEAPEAAPDAAAPETEAPADEAAAPETEAPADDAAAPEAPEAEAPEAEAPPSDTADAPEPAAPEVSEAPEPRPDDLGEAPAEAATDAPDAAAEAPGTTVEDEIPEVSSAVPPETPAESTVADDIPEVSSAVPPEAPAEEAQGMAVTDDTAPPAAAAAAADQSAEGTEVEETVVTEEGTRSSAEDFATGIIQQIAPAPAEGAAASEDAGGNRRETLQRALAAGLAGAALGALLNQGNEVAVDSGDRLVLRQDDGNLRLFRDENALLRQPGARVRTETFDDGSTRTTVLRDDESRVVTIRAADGSILRRTRILPDGREVLLIDDMEQATPVEVSRLPEPRREAVRYSGDEEALRQALARATAQDVGRSFSLRQIREIDRVRYLAPEVELDEITFATGSAAIEPGQAQQLAALGRTMVALIEENPAEVFLVEGHTDAVGNAGYNLALSDRRAESVALALTEYFDVPPENLVVQGYGEFDLKVPTETAERANRRANVRRITGLLGMEEAALR